MPWKDIRRQSRVYLVAVYAVGAVLPALCLTSTRNDFNIDWLALTVASGFVATVNVRLPQTAAAISMGDVLTILALVHFGPGPALITYWLQVTVGGSIDHYRHHGIRFFRHIAPYRFGFNFAQASISMWPMSLAFGAVTALNLPNTASSIAGLGAIAITWFLINTVSLSLAIALTKGEPFWPIWTNGIRLYLLNFLGSAGAAGLISLFYEQTSYQIFLLALPIVALFYQLYSFYIDKFEAANRHIEELNKLYLQTVEALATAVDAKDRYTHGHIRRVQAYSVALARLIGLTDENDVMAMKAGALLHDIGKIAIPEFILNKPTVLTESEFEKMKIHPSVGASMLEGIDFPFPVEPLVKSHHERWDGKGYPEGLKGEEIPLNARILSLVDCYDALTTDRPYRSPMTREELVEFFRRESGRAYDPAVVETFLANLDVLEEAGARVPPLDRDIWGIVANPTENVRAFQNVEPVTAYTKAMKVDLNIQMDLYSIFEFVRSARALQQQDIMLFIGIKLQRLIPFDAGVFYLADPENPVVVPGHVVGRLGSTISLNLALPLDQKLSGWVAANNQALSNLPPFPDFLSHDDPKPSFEISAIAPMCHRGNVIGSLALYRQEKARFTDEEFRRLELIAGQCAAALYRARSEVDPEATLFDEVTGLPNGYQVYMMFDQVAVDAQRYDYSLTLLAFRVEDLTGLRRRFGHLSANEILRRVGQRLKDQMRETDILVRYSDDQFLTLHPKIGRDQAETLKSRIQDLLDRDKIPIRQDVEIAPRVSVGIVEFPQEGTRLEDLLPIAERRLDEDQSLRSAARKTLAFPK